MFHAHALLCVQGARPLGQLRNAMLKYKHREVHSPEGVNWGHLSLLRYKFAEVHSPEGVKGDVLVVFE